MKPPNPTGRLIFYHVPKRVTLLISGWEKKDDNSLKLTLYKVKKVQC